MNETIVGVVALVVGAALGWMINRQRSQRRMKALDEDAEEALKKAHAEAAQAQRESQKKVDEIGTSCRRSLRK